MYTNGLEYYSTGLTLSIHHTILKYFEDCLAI